MVNIPKIKKKVQAFLTREEGKISKESLLKAGTFVGAIALSSALAVSNADAAHTNSLSLSHGGTTATGTHTHHASHSSHGSHGSHGACAGGI